MRRTDQPIGFGAILTLVIGVAAVGFLGSTLVLGLLGAQSAVMWTGTSGCVLLAGWLLAANGRTRRRIERVGHRADAGPLDR